VFVEGAVAEPLAFAELLAAHPDAAAGVEFTAPGIPGLNRVDYAGLHPTARLTAFMAPPGLADPESAPRIRLLPLSYGPTARRLADSRFDVVVVQVAPPDADGLCAFGVGGDFAPLVWRKAGLVVAFVNPRLARPQRCETIPFAAIGLAVDAERPLPTAPLAPPSPPVAEAARRAAALVPDGATLQTGVGAAPLAVLDHLKDRKNLVIRSGLISDGHLALCEANALDRRRAHIAGLAFGGQDLYEALHGADLFAFASVRQTHDPVRLGRSRLFTAVNSALEVDLYGQANVEWRAGRAVSGVGGAPEFAAAAQRSRGGQFILVLPARAGGAARIVPRLASPTVSLPRGAVDAVVTEFGVAQLGGLGVEERAAALIAIAHPDDRPSLGQAFEALMRGAPPGG
jgi:acyl-CoA hydrolase